MAGEKEPLKCPVCGAGILAVANTTLVKCEKNDYKDGQQHGCDFLIDLKPKVLKGQQITRDQVQKMLEGDTVEFKVGTGRIDPNKGSGYYFTVQFPENGYF